MFISFHFRIVNHSIRMKSIFLKCAVIFAVWAVTVHSSRAQAPRQKNSSEILLDLNKLNVLGNVLYLAAHPDDENTRLIGYLANQRLFNTAYLSCTRGDGGQNLIGTEISEQLGIIRTQELLAARRTDGSFQFFTRANDFGYSKSADETLQIWDKDKVLADIVWVIRNFRPDVIVTRFPPDSRAGHGQHESSAILAEEAFELANDPSAFPEQLQYTSVWQPKRLLWNTGRFWVQDLDESDPEVVSINTGEYNPLLGISFGELAAISRSMHKSQGFGSSGSRGDQTEYLVHKMGSLANGDIMDGIDVSWDRVSGGTRIKQLVDEAISSYDMAAPEKSVPQLLNIRKEIVKLSDDFWKNKKLSEVDQLIKNCMGIYLALKSNESQLTHGDSINIDVEVINRSGIDATLQSLTIPALTISESYKESLGNNNRVNHELKSIVPEDLPITQPYWLDKKGTLGVYRVDDQQKIGKPENDPPITGKFSISINGEVLILETPVIYQWTDPVKGEMYSPLSITPAAYTQLEQEVLMFPTEEPKTVKVRVKAGKASITGELTLELPSSWKVNPQSQSVDIAVKGAEKIFEFTILPPKEEEIAEVRPVIRLNDGTVSRRELNIIEYDHIPRQVLFPEASSKLVRVKIEKRGDRVGYIMGAGDKIPVSLEQIGYSVWNMNDDEVTAENLSQLDAVILGVRALNTNERISFQMPLLLEFVKNGGTLVIQYNTTRGLKTREFSPYELSLSRDRVAEEDANVEILLPDHPALNVPNKITQDDFKGWVQERGLYFPNQWGSEFDALLSSHDQGEDPKNGGLLVAKYGEGYYVYSGYSWFRELPAGVPGAYKLFTNLISLGQREEPENTSVGKERRNKQ